MFHDRAVHNHLSPGGSQRPPACEIVPLAPPDRPKTIISLRVQTAVCSVRAEGTAPVVLVANHLSPGTYRPPVASGDVPLVPPQRIISVPVQTAVCSRRAAGRTPDELVGVHESETGL